ncbi:hypothetical protein LOAG_04579 [Loa loa]|uniref:Uncharacterized protein n=1 Tax=Loa loa TaxID=7209 RepID=A0A1S0U1Q8_LOALO|nr:hypothetical protein LOAG_04579 [Loa loa]EFO23909.1 hypothetical protein LOAG_04579 [Loa loa]
MCVAACFNDDNDRNGLQFDTEHRDGRVCPYTLIKQILSRAVLLLSYKWTSTPYWSLVEEIQYPKAVNEQIKQILKRNGKFALIIMSNNSSPQMHHRCKDVVQRGCRVQQGS